MANTMYKEWLVISAATLDKKTGKWIARITINYTTHPPGSFDTEQEAEAFGLKFATDFIDARTK